MMRVIEAVVVAAISIGVFNHFASDIRVFLQIPYVGFYLYAATGGTMPPYFDPLAMSKCHDEEKCPWLTPGSVVINVCAKCGTNWMVTVVHELRTWNFTNEADKDFAELPEISPFIEYVYHPGMNLETKYKAWPKGWNRTEFPFRQFMTHIPPFQETSHGVLEVREPVVQRPDVKFLVVIRNPVDMILSAYDFFQKGNPEALKRWGGMPNLEVTFESVLDRMINTRSGSSFAPGFYMAWKPLENQKNVLLLHYSDIFKNPEKYIREIAKFIEIDVPDEGIQKVLKRTSIEFMKNRNNRYNVYVDEKKTIKQLLDDALVNKGGLGRGKSMDEKYKVMIDNYVKGLFPDDKDRKFLYNGKDE